MPPHGYEARGSGEHCKHPPVRSRAKLWPQMYFCNFENCIFRYLYPTFSGSRRLNPSYPPGSGSYPYVCWAQLAHSEKWGRSFDKVIYQNSPPIFHWANYILNESFSIKGEETQNRGKNLSQKLWGDLRPKLGGSCT